MLSEHNPSRLWPSNLSHFIVTFSLSLWLAETRVKLEGDIFRVEASFLDGRLSVHGDLIDYKVFQQFPVHGRHVPMWFCDG